MTQRKIRPGVVVRKRKRANKEHVFSSKSTCFSCGSGGWCSCDRKSMFDEERSSKGEDRIPRYES